MNNLLEEFRDKVVVITGASSGIGEEMALLLAEHGACLSLVARSRERTQAVAVRCRELGGKALVVPADVSIQDACREAVEITKKKYGRIDMLVLNAGIGMWARFEEIRGTSMLRCIMEVNFWGSLNCAFYALPYLKESMGQIVAVSSLAGKTGIPFFSVYGASKAALERFLEALRIELEGTGVTVTIAYPGFVDTGMEGRVIVSDEKSAKRKPLPKEEMMTAPECARKILEAAARRDREIVMTLKGKFGQWLKLIAPGLVDKMASKATEGR